MRRSQDIRPTSQPKPEANKTKSTNQELAVIAKYLARLE